VIILALLAIALGVIFFGYKFELSDSWWDVVVKQQFTIMNVSKELNVPSFSVLIFILAGVGIIWLVAFLAKRDTSRVVEGINTDDAHTRLVIQYLPRSFSFDMMNLNAEKYAVWVWLAPWLAQTYVMFFVVKYLLALIMLWIVNTFGIENDMLANIILWGLQWLIDVNGIVTFMYGIVIWYGLNVHQQEQLMVTDVEAMQAQLRRKRDRLRSKGV
jgi:hypothetical protein